MNLQVLFEQYWPVLALGLWFTYKWWNSRRVLGLLPDLKKEGAVLVDVRSAAEFASGSAPGTRSGMAKMVLKKNGYARVYNVGTWRKFLP